MKNLKRVFVSFECGTTVSFVVETEQQNALFYSNGDFNICVVITDVDTTFDDVIVDISLFADCHFDYNNTENFVFDNTNECLLSQAKSVFETELNSDNFDKYDLLTFNKIQFSE